MEAGAGALIIDEYLQCLSTTADIDVLSLTYEDLYERATADCLDVRFFLAANTPRDWLSMKAPATLERATGGHREEPMPAFESMVMHNHDFLVTWHTWHSRPRLKQSWHSRRECSCSVSRTFSSHTTNIKADSP